MAQHARNRTRHRAPRQRDRGFHRRPSYARQMTVLLVLLTLTVWAASQNNG
ncbi:hypothetical protein ABT071_21885 [Streptomyces sp. NPDC002506]|uniref:hypothetical protein n=1 Tax=Streptomyces sp. NPDC002506 TaxID=3154536 RepID=UPI0033274C21